MLPDILLPCSSNGKEPACSAGDLGSIPGLEDPLEKGMAAHCGLLDGESQGEEPGGSQPVRSQSGTWLSYTHTHTRTHTRTHTGLLRRKRFRECGAFTDALLHIHVTPLEGVTSSVCCFYLLFVHREFHLCEGLGSAIGSCGGFCSISIPQFIPLLVATPIVFLSKQCCCEYPPWGLQRGFLGSFG